jgi:hypothetical protein
MIESRLVCVCDACGHVWLPTADPASIKRCSKCKSAKWNQARPSPVVESCKTHNLPGCEVCRLIDEAHKRRIEKDNANAAAVRAAKVFPTPAYARPAHLPGCRCMICNPSD